MFNLQIDCTNSADNIGTPFVTHTHTHTYT